MAENYESKAKKKIGCLGIVLIILLALALIAGSIYIFLPKILSSALSGGMVSTLIPEGMQDNIKDLQNLVSENIILLEEYGLSADQAAEIVSSLDYDTLETCLDDIQQSSIKNSSELLDTVSKYVDLSGANLGKIKKDLYTDFKDGELDQQIEELRDNPLMGKSGFSILKATIIEVLNSRD